MFPTSLRNCDQACVGVCFFCSTRWNACEAAFWKSPWCGPSTCGRSFRAEVAKALPTGAFEKNGFLNDWTALLLRSADWLRRLPVCLKIAASEAGDVRYLIRSAASAWCCDCFGTERNEPPQLPPLLGTAAMSHLPFVARAWPWM